MKERIPKLADTEIYLRNLFYFLRYKATSNCVNIERGYAGWAVRKVRRMERVIINIDLKLLLDQYSQWRLSTFTINNSSILVVTNCPFPIFSRNNSFPKGRFL